MIIVCQECKKKFEHPNRRKKFCCVCARERHLAQQRKWIKEWYLKEHKNKFTGEPRSCKECGCFFTPSHWSSLYCDECAETNRLLNEAKYYARRSFYKLCYENIEAATKLKNDALKEEGPEFTELLCDGAIEKVKAKRELGT